ncbi:MAG: hypothetical protein JOZ13_17015 [Alphaproteobacteria bacterium]|nr:hypothetical protein [Alphaproteobacteria bacterium]
MRKIPVGGAIARAYGFGFGHFFTNVALVWSSVALLWAATWFLQQPYLRAMSEIDKDPHMVSATYPMYFLFSLVSLVLVAAQSALITREALGLRTGSALLQFPFGPATWRLAVAFFFYWIVLIVLYVGLFFAILLGLGLVAAAHLGGVGAAIFAIAIIIGLLAFFYIAMRLSFFLAPVAVAERRISLIRAWELAAGNGGRIVVIFIAIFLPFAVAEIAAGIAFVAPLFKGVHAGMTDPERQVLIRSVAAAIASATRNSWYIFYPLSAALGVLLYGMLSGAAALGYQALTREETIPTA